MKSHVGGNDSSRKQTSPFGASRHHARGLPDRHGARSNQSLLCWSTRRRRIASPVWSSAVGGAGSAAGVGEVKQLHGPIGNLTDAVDELMDAMVDATETVAKAAAGLSHWEGITHN